MAVNLCLLLTLYNLYLLNDSTIQILSQCQIRSVSISLDGAELTHDSRRFLPLGGHTLNRFLGSLKSKLTVSFGLILPIAHLDKWNSNICLSIEEFSACIFKFSACMAELEFNILYLYHFYSSPKNTFCAAVHRNSFLIRPDGSIGKCFDCDLSVGDVFNAIAHDSNTQYNLFLRLDFNPFNNPECTNCNVLPICLGG